VDFLATDFEGHRQLIKVAASISSPAVFEREVHALAEARQEFPDAETLVVTETDPPREARAPEGIKIMPIWQWLLTR
jgi:predicted AAA+ superfamily ATPase